MEQPRSDGAWKPSLPATPLQDVLVRTNVFTTKVGASGVRSANRATQDRPRGASSSNGRGGAGAVGGRGRKLSQPPSRAGGVHRPYENAVHAPAYGGTVKGYGKGNAGIVSRGGGRANGGLGKGAGGRGRGGELRSRSAQKARQTLDSDGSEPRIWKADSRLSSKAHEARQAPDSEVSEPRIWKADSRQSSTAHEASLGVNRRAGQQVRANPTPKVATDGEAPVRRVWAPSGGAARQVAAPARNRQVASPLEQNGGAARHVAAPVAARQIASPVDGKVYTVVQHECNTDVVMLLQPRF